jgi:hypothetical protein
MEDLEAQRLHLEELDLPLARNGAHKHLDLLVTWSHDFLNRGQDGCIYPELLDRNTLVCVESEARDQ